MIARTQRSGVQETIEGTLLGNHLTFTATYVDPVDNGYSWSYDGLLAGGTATSSIGQAFEITSTFSRGDDSTWKNHGEYVAAHGGDSDAAHSCIGMPIR